MVLTVLPGLDTATVLRTSAFGGPRHGACAAIGIAVGCLIWGTGVSLGLGALLSASPIAFAGLRLAGAAYLMGLGLKLLLERPRHNEAVVEGGPASEGAALRRGFLTNILNPKVGLFYITLLPQFVPAGAPLAAYSFMLACIHASLAAIWFAALAVMTIPVGAVLRQVHVRRRIDVVTAIVFVGFGLEILRARA
jgi:threonine/homoserine/homoserine lactone efflux protein